ncbi:hypothetical protein HHI36_009728 [Cryptolaemus montrouzieri]|uniref:Uncharacterized protein n=1 Tax=Cryptolaemus montrouzieri TaxID=559131 RepID=A0ABD2MGL8_9CUCU
MMIGKPSTSTRDENIISNRNMKVLPADIKPFPRVKTTKEKDNKKSQRKKKKSEILKNTPVLANLEEEEKLKEPRKSSLNRNSSVKRQLDDSLKPFQIFKRRRRSFRQADDHFKQLTDSDDINLFPDSQDQNDFLMNDLSTITTGSFVVVKFPTKKKKQLNTILVA